MSRLRYLLPVLLLSAAGCSAVADGESETLTSAPMTCEIRISDTALGWEVEPVALSASSFAGEYEFTVSKISKGGTAVSSQSGDFEAVAGEPTVLASAVFDRKGSLRAELTVRWSGGVVTCERRFPEV
ncbi:MAG TPA: curli-like amyloid fiber formation chaperone CsgH [Bauldia sp.]|nr:curli-like amyloid fiber formation chaperone CsgH [Bauldia sp.]